jgi:hypothetical protein
MDLCDRTYGLQKKKQRVGDIKMLLRAIGANLSLVGSLLIIHCFASFIISYLSVSFAFREYSIRWKGKVVYVHPTQFHPPS